MQPNLGGAVRKVATPALGSFFIADGQDEVKPGEATLEVWRGSARLASRPLELGHPDERPGRQVGLLPLAALQPGATPSGRSWLTVAIPISWKRRPR
jgi:hypothetical protein